MSSVRTPARFGLPRSLVWRAGLAIMAFQGMVAAALLGWRGDTAVAGVLLVGILATLAIVVAVSAHTRAQRQRLMRGIERLSAGDLGHRFVRPGDLEFSELARSLNAMVEQFEDRVRVMAMEKSQAQTILQSMSSGVIALDREQRIMGMNEAAERMLGIDGDHSRGRLLHEVVRQPELHRLVAVALRDETKEDSDRGSIEFTIATSGQNLHVEARVEALRSAGTSDGNRSASATASQIDDERRPPPTGLLILLNDVTHVRRLESLRSDFAANVSHELRTPITNIKGYIETLLDTGLDDREQATRFLTIVRHNSDRLAAIVEDVLALTRLERASVGASPRERGAGGAADQFPKAPTPVRAILAAAIAQHQAAAMAKSITIELTADPSLTATVHSPLLEQAVGNLISNAVNYSPPRTTVKVSAHSVIPRGLHLGAASGKDATAQDQWIEIAVKDEGPGIAPEHHARIFERFYRIDRGRSREVGGTGLGLAIVKHIVREHRGRVSLDSHPGKGSVFRLAIPKE